MRIGDSFRKHLSFLARTLRLKPLVILNITQNSGRFLCQTINNRETKAEERASVTARASLRVTRTAARAIAVISRAVRHLEIEGTVHRAVSTCPIWDARADNINTVTQS